MKRIIAAILALTLLAAPAAWAAIDTDTVIDMFTQQSNASLDEWRGTTKNPDGTINAAQWFTFPVTSRLSGHVIANYPEGNESAPHPTGTVLYTATNFGSEYRAQGELYIFQNQIYLYFNTAASITDTAASVTGGYRVVINRNGRQLLLQICSNSVWTTLQTIATEAIPYSALQYTLTFADGQLAFSIYGSAAYSYSITEDLTAQSVYYDTGLFGFGANATRMLANKIHVEYQSQKVYFRPEATESWEGFDGFTVWPAGEAVPVWVQMSFRQPSDIKRATLVVDNTANHTLALSDGRLAISLTGLARGVHRAELELEDRYGNVYALGESRFFVGDYYASSAAFAADAATGAPKASFRFRQPARVLENLTAVMVVYNADGTLADLQYHIIEAPQAGILADIDVCAEAALAAGQSAQAFLCEDFARPAPVSGVFWAE